MAQLENTNILGDLVVAGKVTTKGEVETNVNSTVKVLNPLASTSSSTGSLVVSGGVGIGGSLNIGGSLSVNGALTFNNSLTISGANNLIVSGRTLLSDGTAAAPSLSFSTTDTNNTGLYRKDADKIGVSIDGVERTHFDTTGMVVNASYGITTPKITGGTNPAVPGTIQMSLGAGTVDGTLSNTDTPNQSATTRLSWNGYIYTSRLYGVVWNDIADFIEVEDDVEIEYGKAYTVDWSGTGQTKKYGQASIGIATDTYGFAVGKKKGKNQVPIAIGGFVLAHVDVYPFGTPLVATKNGRLTKACMLVRIFAPQNIVGIFYKEENEETWNGIPVNGRHWIKVK